jgi:hypothetical protein
MLAETITLRGGEYLVTRVSSPPLPGYVALEPAESRMVVRDWVRRREATVLADLLRAFHSWRALNPLDEAEAFTQLVETRFDDHFPAFVLYRRELSALAGASASAGAEAAAVALSELASHRPEPKESLRGWIEIQLEDRDGKPIPRARYEVRLPNRELRQGYLDPQGFARLDGLPEGNCEVCFPDYDRSSWNLA